MKSNDPQEELTDILDFPKFFEPLTRQEQLKIRDGLRSVREAQAERRSQGWPESSKLRRLESEYLRLLRQPKTRGPMWTDAQAVSEFTDAAERLRKEGKKRTRENMAEVLGIDLKTLDSYRKRLGRHLSSF